MNRFIIVGENIHCTRIYKVGGQFVQSRGDGRHFIAYRSDGAKRELPIPRHFIESADWGGGKVKHCAVAIWQGMHGEGEERDAGVGYLLNLAKSQESAGAAYLDVNVDEFSTDVKERVSAIQWTIDVAQRAVSIPISVDSSNVPIMRAGLAACDRGRGRAMVNSVSLERSAAIKAAAEYSAVVIASAAGEKGLPSTTEERLANIDAVIKVLLDAGLDLPAIHVDPLVFPISVDGQNGSRFLETVRAVRRKYGAEIHIVAGLSNVSFGMPNRKLINQVFARLALDAGADGGIVDPLQINLAALKALDRKSEGFKLARSLLLGEDEFGMNFITACRDGSLQGA